MNFWPSRDFLDCLGWTLLHFLWQGLVIVALLAVALRLLRRRFANLRYLAGCGALLLMAVAPVASFYSLAQRDEAPSLKFTIKKSAVTYDAGEIAPPSVAPQQSPSIAPKADIYKPTIPERLEALLPWFVATWSVGVLVLSCRLFAGWLLIQRLRRSATTALTGPWQAKLKELARRVGVSRPLRLLQSAWVEVPTVIGWLRPVILLPASCLTGLTPAQLESILAHELAHIRRHDYLINVLQNLVETLLFYHPAVWWVSRRIRAEREHCCDDLAVKICGDAIEYARALATLEELRPAPAQLVLAAGGAPLLERIRRLAGQPERSAVRPAWPVAGIVAVLLLVVLAAGLRNNPASAQSATGTAATNQSQNLPAPTNAVVLSNRASFTTQVVRLVSATNGLVQFGASGGPQANPAGPSAVPPGNRSSFTSRLKKLPPPTNAAAQTDDPSAPEINIKTKFAEIDVAKTGTNGFAWLFKDGEMQKLTNLSATFHFSEFMEVKATNVAETNQRIYLHAVVRPAPLATTLLDTQYQSAIKTLERQNGVDLLTAPEVTTEMGRQAQVGAVDVRTILVGDPQSNGVHTISNQEFGPMLDFIPRLAADGHTVELTMIGTVSEFVGYEDPATITNQAGKPIPKNWAVPHFRNRQFEATVSVGNAQTLVLGSGPVPITTTLHMKDKVPLLGDIPLLGRMFRSVKTTTNTVQKNLMLFVTPTLINPDGTRYRFHEKTNDASLQIEKAWDVEIRNGKLEPRTNAFNRTNLVHTSKGRQAILSKLDHIRLENIAYNNLPLDEVINNLTVIAKARDPEKIGINFFISREAVTAAGAAAPGAIDPATGLPVAPLPIAPDTDIGSVTININHALKDVRLADVLDAITRCADKPIKYSILDYAIVFSLRGPEPIPLEIRTYHVDPNIFRNGLASVIGFSAGGIATNGSIAAGSGNITNSSTNLDQVQVSVRNFFDAVGVDFRTNNSANVGKAFIWNDRKGILTVRSTANDLDLIAAAIETLNEAPPKVNTQSKYAGTIEADSRIQWPLPTNGISSVHQAATNQGTLEIRVFYVNPDAFGRKLGITLTTNAPFMTNSPGEFQTALRKFFASAGADFDTNYPANLGKSFSYTSRKSVLMVRATPEELAEIAVAVEVLNRQLPQIKLKVRFAELTHSNAPALGFNWTLGNVNVSQPMVTNPAGSVLYPITDVPHDVSHFSNDVDHSAVSIGSLTGILTPVQFDIAMRAWKERYGVELPAVPEVATESGRPARIPLGDSLRSPWPTNSIDPELEVSPYVSKGGYSIEMTLIPTVPEFIGYVTNEVGTSQMALPHYRLRTRTASVSVWDGQTVVLGFENGISTNNARKNWMIFVTPTIVNPDGTSLHTEKEIALESEKVHIQAASHP